MNEYIVDVRVGCVAVYQGPAVTCIEDLTVADTAYLAFGKYNSDTMSWELPNKYVRAANRVAYVMNQRLHRTDSSNQYKILQNSSQQYGED